MLTQSQIDRAIQQEAALHLTMAEAAARYEGQWPDTLRPVPSDPRGEDNVSVNLAKVAVDTAVHMLMGTAPQIEVDKSGESPQDKWLREMLDQNLYDQLLIDIATMGAVSGHVYVRLHDTGGDFPEIEILDSQHVTVVRDPVAYKRVTAYIIAAPVRNALQMSRHDPDHLQYQEIVERNERGTWTITRSVREPNGRFASQGEHIEWPYIWAPIFDSKNLPSLACYHGSPDLSRDVIKANTALCFAVSNANRIVRLQGHSKIFVLGADPRSVEGEDGVSASPDDVTFIPSDGAKIEQIAPGVDIVGHIAYIDKLKALFHDVSATPEIALGKVDVGGEISGIGLKIAYQPLVNKTKTKRNLYGDLLKRLCRAALEMGGFGPDRTITITWGDMLPEVEVEKLTAAKLRKELGVSTSTILMELGYEDAEDEIAKAKAENDRKIPQNPPAQPIAA